MAKKQVKRRQQVVRRQGNGFFAGFRRWLTEDVGLTLLVCATVFFVAATALALIGSHSRTFAVGEKISQPIYADVDFEVHDEQQTLRLQQAARASTPSHYTFDDSVVAAIGTELQNLYQAASASETFEAFEGRSTDQGWLADEAAYELLRSYANDTNKQRFEDSIARLRKNLETEYIVDQDAERDRTPPSSAKVIIVHSSRPTEDPSAVRPREVKRFDLLPISNTTGLQRAAHDLSDKSGFATALRSVVATILVKHLSTQPLLVYRSAFTHERMAAEADLVEPVKVLYGRNEPFLLARKDQGLTAAELELLAAHDAAYGAYLESDSEGAKELRERELFRRIGVATVYVLLTVALFSYVVTYERRIFEKPGRAFGLVTLLLLAIAGARVLDAQLPIKELVMGPPLFVASILAIAYSRRFAMRVMTLTSVILILSVRGDIALLVTLLVGVRATVELLNDIRTRTRLIAVGILSALVMFLSGTAFGLIGGQSLAFASIRGAWAGASGIASAVLLQAMLPLVEQLFGIATSLTLLEWRDTTRPLLQRLAREAPGTYTHSLTLGTLAENACREIGANGLLTQVGALYHDIGKIYKASYFAENQQASINRHDHLSPSMSLLIIIGHVKDGLEMAKEYKLPRVLRQFIGEHHGTTVVKYFHYIASEQQTQAARGRHDREVPESQFRYPGPKPRSRESAVLMLCDGTESAIRSLADPTPGRIENLVHQIVTDRLNDGQFGDCDITLRELQLVEESLVKSLCSHYHGRVSYPKAKDKPERPTTGVPSRSAAG